MPGPAARKLTVYEIPAEVTLEVFRVVKVSSIADPALADSFRSHFELKRPPRKIEATFIVVHMGVSCWRSEEGARKLATSYPTIGAHVARLEIEGGKGFNASSSVLGGSQHLTVWGDPIKLAAVVTDVVPV